MHAHTALEHVRSLLQSQNWAYMECGHARTPNRHWHMRRASVKHVASTRRGLPDGRSGKLVSAAQKKSAQVEQAAAAAAVQAAEKKLQAAELELKPCTARCPTTGICFPQDASVVRGRYLELWSGMGSDGPEDRVYTLDDKCFVVSAQTVLALHLSPVTLGRDRRKDGTPASSAELLTVPRELWQLGDADKIMIMQRHECRLHGSAS